MKKLIIFCFVVLLTVLSVLSCLNFNISAQEQFELDKATITIVKPDGLTNTDFLSSLDDALASLDADIMYRYVRENEGKTEYCYFKTNHTEDFLDIAASSGSITVGNDNCISTRNYPAYKVTVLRVSSLTQDFSIFTWEQAASFDLSSASYFVKAEQADIICSALTSLGYRVTKDPSVAISTQFSIALFSFIPAFMVVVSMVFDVLSNGKKNVLKKMEGYSTFDIILDEVKQTMPALLWCAGGVETITMIAAVFLYPAATIQFMIFSAPSLFIAFTSLLVGCIISAILIARQKSSAHIKGKAPKKGIYVTTMVAKCVFIAFVMIFLTIAIRNVASAFRAFQASQFLTRQVEGYITVPINNSNISYEILSGMDKQYEAFYLSTVDQYNGVLIDTSNYHHDLISGTTKAEEHGQDYIFVNRNYLEINPVYGIDGSQIDGTFLPDKGLTLLIPDGKLEKAEEYQMRFEKIFDDEINELLYDADNSRIYAFNAEASATIDAPIIVVLDNRHISAIYMFIQSWGSRNCYLLHVPSDDPYAELKPILEQTGIAKATVSVPSVKSTFADIIHQQFQMLLIYGTQSAVLMSGLFCLVIFCSRLYCENYRRKIACCLIDGYSLGRCMKKHWRITVSIYAVIGMLMFLITQMGMFSFEQGLLLITFVCEAITIVLTSRRLTSKNLYQIVKGEE